jgi:transposase
VLIDRTNGRIVDVLESREKARVVDWLKAGVASGLLGEVEEVTTDMWDGYVEATREVFGSKVRITVDRFHVMANFQESLTGARRQIQRTLPKEAAAELKGTRWTWLTNWENLTEEQRQTLEALKRKYPPLQQLADRRESLRQIFEDRTIATAAAGVERLKQWCREARELGLAALGSFVGTLERWMDRIANYFVSRSTNAETEGYNHGIRAILWRAFGMRNFAHFRARVLHVFG